MIKSIELNSKLIDDLSFCFLKVFSKERVVSTLKENKFTKYIAYIIDNQLIGCINYTFLSDQMELIDINVREEFWGQNIGKKLIEYMLEDAKSNNIVSIFLEVNVENARAIHLYKKYNFNIISERKGYYNGEDAFVMERKM